MAVAEKPTARAVALQVLMEVEEKKAFSNLGLHAALQRTALDRREAALATELVYGTLSRLNTLDWVANQLLKKPIHRLEPWLRSLLRLSIYQLHYLDKIPDRAVVHEAVELAKLYGHKGTVALVNGLLRNVTRVKEWTIPEQWPKYKKIAIEYSHPEWLVKRWLGIYGEKETIGMCRVNNQPPPVSVRVNRLKATREVLAESIWKEYEDAEIRFSSVAPDGLLLGKVGNIALSEAFRQGLCTIQDETSMLVAYAVEAGPGMAVLDTCAAPGGKTTHIGETMQNQGTILALDIHPHKLKLIEESARRLGVDIIRTKQADARNLSENLRAGGFDRILVDAPCSGFGVIRRKPDLKWQKTQEDIAVIADMQLQILEEASRFLKVGGYLIYSTCTVDPEENARLIHRFVDQHPDFALDESLAGKMPEALRPYFHRSGAYVQILPHYFGSDGFFISRIKRIR